MPSRWKEIRKDTLGDFHVEKEGTIPIDINSIFVVSEHHWDGNRLLNTTLILFQNKHVRTVICETVTKPFRNKIAELLFHCVHQSHFEGNSCSIGHST